jgi:ATP/maltotriose-dependent transcriptional regulator MalT
MTDFTVEWWLILQLVIETGLCVLIVYYIYGAKNLRREIMLDKEKMKTAGDSLQRLIKKSEELDKKHQLDKEKMKTAVDSLRQLIKKSEELDKKRRRVLERCGKIEGKGPVLETGFDRYREDCEESDSIAHSYEQVACLIEKGLSANEISQKLRMPRGEVELVMNLKRQ